MLLKEVSTIEAAEIIEQDYCYGAKRRDLPPFLKNQGLPKIKLEFVPNSNSLNQRQLKHLPLS